MLTRTLTQSQRDLLVLPTLADMQEAAADIFAVEQASMWRHNGGPATFLTVGPGLVQVSKRKPGWRDRAADLELQRRFRDVCLNVSMGDEAAAEASSVAEVGTLAKRGKILGWSKRSRNRMQIKLNSLDWSPLFDQGLEPALVTLTMPGDWQQLTPTPSAYKRKIESLKVAYRRSWGVPIRGVWKQEFQRRGAPHTHILTTPPAGLSALDAPRGGLPFAAWLSETWAAIVGATGDELVRHRAAGTGVDYVGDAYRDPRRIASYFGKHGLFEAKGYQNEMPELWLRAIAGGEAGTQFWGVWGLTTATVELQLHDGDREHNSPLSANGLGNPLQYDEDSKPWASDASVSREYQRNLTGSSSSDSVRVQRHLRKLSRSLAFRSAKLVKNRHGIPVMPRSGIRRVERTMVCYATGELITRRSYRIGYYHGGGGFLLVHDGRRTASDIARIIGRKDRFEQAA